MSSEQDEMLAGLFRKSKLERGLEKLTLFSKKSEKIIKDGPIDFDLVNMKLGTEAKRAITKSRKIFTSLSAGRNNHKLSLEGWSYDASLECYKRTCVFCGLAICFGDNIIGKDNYIIFNPSTNKISQNLIKPCLESTYDQMPRYRQAIAIERFNERHQKDMVYVDLFHRMKKKLIADGVIAKDKKVNKGGRPKKRVVATTKEVNKLPKAVLKFWDSDAKLDYEPIDPTNAK